MQLRYIFFLRFYFYTMFVYLYIYCLHGFVYTYCYCYQYISFVCCLLFFLNLSSWFRNFHKVSRFMGCVLCWSRMLQTAVGKMLKHFLKYQLPTYCCKESLKIPSGQWESIKWKTDNTMAKHKTAKGQTMINKRLHRKL